MMGRILVIDDESNIRMMVRLALQHAGYDVQTAADGAEGLDKYGDGTAWDVVLLDHRMPGVTGMDVLREMRQRKADARVIVITAFGTIDLAAEAMREGATDFLRKPFSADTLRDAVSLALASQNDGGAGGGFEAGINGFRIEGERGSPEPAKGDVQWLFSVRGPRGDRRDCAVLLPGFIVDQVRAHARTEQIPGGGLFWQSLCEEALANYIWQNAEFPPDRLLRVDDLTNSMLRKVHAAISAA